MKFSEIYNETEADLKKMANDFREKLRVFHFNSRMGKVKNVREIRQTRRDIARILTALKQKSKK